MSGQSSFIQTIKEKTATDIRFWILLFFVLRLYGITDPPLEVAHSWRQCFTNAVALYYYEHGNSFFYPSAAIFGNSKGIVGTEFPLFSYLIFIVAKLVGYAHWYGRLINLVVSSIGIYYFYRCVLESGNKKLAFYSTLLLLTSVWFIFSRKSMPDTFSVSLTIIGIYYGIIYFKDNKKLPLLLYFLFATLGILSKIPSLFLLSFFLYFFLSKTYSLRSKIIFSVVSIATVVIVSFWYFIWVPYLESLEGNRLFFPKSITEGLNELSLHIGEGLEKFYFVAFQSFAGFFLFLLGIYFSLKNRLRRELLVLSALTIVFLLFIIKTGAVFPTHSYYIIPYVPVMALVAAYGLLNINQEWLKLFLISFVLIESLLNQQDDFKIKKDEWAKLNLSSIADSVSDSGDLIAVSGGESPQFIYFTDRAGWRLKNEELKQTDLIDSISKKGCKYLFLDKKGIDIINLHLSYKVVYEDEYFLIMEL